MTKIEHPFAKVCRAVFKEKYPDKESAIPEDSSLAVNDIPEDVMTEALKRYFAGKKLIIGPRVRARSANATIMLMVRHLSLLPFRHSPTGLI